MFENLLGQAAAGQLIQDIEAGVLAPAMLFSGPPVSGKGTAALELGRVISCESGSPSLSGSSDGQAQKASWKCGCPSCSRHRLLIHPDLLCLGWKPFSAEIAASAETFLREAESPQARLLFIRAIRKLLARFNPVLWEDDPKAGKLYPLVNSLEEDLDELEVLGSGLSAKAAEPSEKSAVAQLTGGMLKNAFKLESEGIGEIIPITQIRRASYWSRLAPSGRGKLLVIENADRMQEEVRNSLLKLLEEPPGRMTIVLTSARPHSLLPTILSRLRPYRFNFRDGSVEEEVVRRVFRDDIKVNGACRGLGAYLDSFLPVSGVMLEALAAFFAASAAFKAALLCKKQGRPLPEEVILLGKFCAPKAEAAGLGRPRGEAGALIPAILEKADNFEIRSLFSRFLRFIPEQVSLSLKQAPSSFLPSVVYNEIWKECINWAETAVGVYKLRPAQAMEKLFTDLSRRLAAL